MVTDLVTDLVTVLVADRRAWRLVPVREKKKGGWRESLLRTILA
jgi:hypothetical protein